MYHYGYGIGRYIQQIITALESLEDANVYYIFLAKASWDQYRPSNPRFHKILADIPWYSIREQIVMPLLAKKYHIDLMHYPNFNVPLISAVPYIVTIHDLTMLTSPHSARIAASTRSRIRYEVTYAAYRLILHRAVSRARHVITVSQSAKNDIVKYLRINPAKITVIYNGAMKRGRHEKQPAQVDGPFYLSVGSSYPHKNVERLLYVWALLKKEGFQIPLVLCGQEDVFRDRIVLQIHKLGLTQLVVHLGMISDEELSWLYSHTRGLISASFAEGFGLPAVEALGYGVPSIISRLPIFEETLGDCAYYFDPNDAEDMATTILRYDKDEKIHGELREKCLTRAIRYDWSKAALQTHAIYQRYVSK